VCANPFENLPSLPKKIVDPDSFLLNHDRRATKLRAYKRNARRIYERFLNVKYVFAACAISRAKAGYPQELRKTTQGDSFPMGIRFWLFPVVRMLKEQYRRGKRYLDGNRSRVYRDRARVLHSRGKVGDARLQRAAGQKVYRIRTNSRQTLV